MGLAVVGEGQGRVAAAVEPARRRDDVGGERRDLDGRPALQALDDAALIIGAVAGILCQEAVNLIRNKLKIDDTLDVMAVHGVGGIFGTLMKV